MKAWLIATSLMITLGPTAASGQEATLAATGQGLLPEPPQAPATLEGAPPAHPFEPDAAGTLSRTLFSSDEDPNFKIVVRDISIPPDQQTHTLNLPTAALVQLRGAGAEIRIRQQRIEPVGAPRMTATAPTAMDVVNTGQANTVIRTYGIEVKVP
jgi:hypothetical protein